MSTHARDSAKLALENIAVETVDDLDNGDPTKSAKVTILKHEVRVKVTVSNLSDLLDACVANSASTFPVPAKKFVTATVNETPDENSEDSDAENDDEEAENDKEEQGENDEDENEDGAGEETEIFEEASGVSFRAKMKSSPNRATCEVRFLG